MKFAFASAVLLAASSAFANDISVDDSYARASRPGAPTGAMFMAITNAGTEADRLTGVSSDVAQMVELHTHIEEDGVMRMRPMANGIEIPAGETHMLERGGDHVMLMGLTRDLNNGDTVPLTLIFEKAGEISLDVVVDNARQQGSGN